MHSGNIMSASEKAAKESNEQLRDLWNDISEVMPLKQEEMISMRDGKENKKDAIIVLYAPWCPFSQVNLK